MLTKNSQKLAKGGKEPSSQTQKIDLMKANKVPSDHYKHQANPPGTNIVGQNIAGQNMAGGQPNVRIEYFQDPASVHQSKQTSEGGGSRLGQRSSRLQLQEELQQMQRQNETQYINITSKPQF